MIASSHWTSTEQSFRQLASITPCAVTLKTTSAGKGGTGTGSRDKLPLLDSFGNLFAGYTDGPPALELWDVSTTYQMTKRARGILPATTLIGLSVLQQEDYARIAQQLDIGQYAYVELNWKYSFRGIDGSHLETHLDKIRADLEGFIAAFHGTPLLIKLSRETTPYLSTAAFLRLLDLIEEAQAGLIVANSKRMVVAPSRLDERSPAERVNGVITGEYLFLDTYDLIHTIKERHPRLPIVASGGIADIGTVVDAIAVGADAVQLCTVLDRDGIHAVSWLRDQLDQVVRDLDCPYKEWQQTIRTDAPLRGRAIVAARECRWDARASLDAIFSEPDLLTALTANALLSEFADVSFPVESELPAAAPEGARIAVMRGNVSAFLLAQRCVTFGKLTPIQLHYASDLTNKAAAGMDYDFAILPQSTLRAAANQRKLGGTPGEPISVGQIGTSRFELVGDKRLEVKQVRFVYHFGGPSSRGALDNLLLSAHPECNEIGGSQLFPLLRFWRPQGAILAKAPLSRLYGHLAQPQSKDVWGSIWSTGEPLVLVASRKFLSADAGGHRTNAFLRWIAQQQRSILSDLESAARETLSAGFLFYVARLFSSGR